MSRILSLTLMLTLALPALVWSDATTERETRLKWKFPPGQTLKYRQKVNFKIHMKLPQGERNLDMNMLMDYDQTANSVGKGSTVVVIHIRRVAVQVGLGSPGTGFSYDSSNPQQKESAKRDPRLSKFAQLEGKKIKLHFNMQNKLTKVEDGGVGAVGMGASSKADWEQIYLAFPMSSLTSGAHWTKTYQKVSSGMPLAVDAKYTFEKVSNEGGQKVAHIKSKSRISLNSNNSSPAAQQFDITISQSSGQGHHKIDVNGGFLISYSSKSAFTMKLVSKQNPSMVLNQKIKVTSTVEKR